ncbi:unnamed protein product, partial [marine sediment metagenome]
FALSVNQAAEAAVHLLPDTVHDTPIKMHNRRKIKYGPREGGKFMIMITPKMINKLEDVITKQPQLAYSMKILLIAAIWELAVSLRKFM